MPGDSARIVSNLKAALRARGVTYAQLASRIGLSEASVKRVLSRGTLSLRRLEQICDAVGTSVADVVQMAHQPGAERAAMLSFEQEKALATDFTLLACYHLIANGRGSADIRTQLKLTAQSLSRALARLKELGLVSLSPRGQLRTTAGAAVNWRPDGPVRRMYEREVRAEFLQSLFSAERESLHFISAELSEASCRVLQRRLDRLMAEFRDLAELDSALPAGQKRNFGCLLAMRPWALSRFVRAAGSSVSSGRRQGLGARGMK